MSLPRSHAATTYLLGGIDGGGGCSWTTAGGTPALYTLRNGHLRTFRRIDDSQGGHSFLLAPDGRSVVEIDAPTTVHTDDLHLRRLRPTACGTEGFGGFWELLAYDGETVWLTKSRHTGRGPGQRARSRSSPRQRGR